jgi:hypothetical protein
MGISFDSSSLNTRYYMILSYNILNPCFTTINIIINFAFSKICFSFQNLNQSNDTIDKFESNFDLMIK